MIRDVEHLFIYLLAICMSFWGKKNVYSYLLSFFPCIFLIKRHDYKPLIKIHLVKFRLPSSPLIFKLFLDYVVEHINYGSLFSIICIFTQQVSCVFI